jgi:phage gp36-like protein
MAYSTPDDIKKLYSEKKLIQLVDDNNAGLTWAQASPIIADIIAKVAPIINGYLRSRYALPLQSNPELINTTSIDLTAYELHKRRGIPVSDELKDSYDKAFKMLKEIATGLIDLGISGQSGGTEYFIKTNKTYADRMFGDGSNIEAQYNIDNM